MGCAEPAKCLIIHGGQFVYGLDNGLDQIAPQRTKHMQQTRKILWAKLTVRQLSREDRMAIDALYSRQNA
jgi:hypothetical protein